MLTRLRAIFIHLLSPDDTYTKIIDAKIKRNNCTIREEGPTVRAALLFDLAVTTPFPDPSQPTG